MPNLALLWDTCVVYRWFNGQPAEYLDHISKYLEEIQSGGTEIFISTVTLAEIRPSKVSQTGKTPIQVLNSMSSAFRYIDTSPDIMSLAGHLRDQTYQLSDGPEEKATYRDLGLGDAIHLATAVALQEEFGVQNLSVHTFDEGKRRDGETRKKTVPMIGFERWCRTCSADEEVQKVLSLKITKPEHPLCPLPKKPKLTSSEKPRANSKPTMTKPGSMKS